MTERSVFPPVITASAWSSAYSAAWNRALARRGNSTSSLDGTVAPKLTNAEAVSLVKAWTDAATEAKFPLWYQFAAVAYGWDPPDNDALDTTDARADRLYPGDLGVQLWVTLRQLALEMDDTSAPPRLAFESTFADPAYIGKVRASLLQDGASATFKIPLPACKDPKTGKPTGKLHRNPKTGKWECAPVTIDDPITAIGNSFASALLILGLVWLLASDDNKPRRRRRT